MSDTWMGRIQPLWRIFLSGLAAVLPLAITIWLVVWLGRGAENLFGSVVRALFPEWIYFPGLGILCAIGVVMLIGLFMQQWAFTRLVGLGEELIQRIPLVKTLYTGVRDVLDFVSRANKRTDLQRVVLVELEAGVQTIGFVTDEDAGTALPELYAADGVAEGANLIAVYMPMSCQIGGYTLYLPRDRVRPLDLSVEDAMRVVLTAGVNRARRAGD